MDEIIIKYRAEIDGYKAELENIKKADKTTREVVEKPININANTKDLKDALKAIAVASGEIDFINIDQELNALVKDSGKLKKLFDELANSASKMEKGSAEYNGLLSVMGAIDAEIKSLTQSTETFEDTSVQATKSLRAQLREAQSDVARLSDEFGATSKEAVAAAKRAAELKDAIGDAKALTDAFNPDAKFQALTASLGGVLGGFQAYEGALALIGSESEDLQKTLVKLQGVMALSQGLQQLGEAKDSFNQLGAVVKDKVMTAFTTLRGAMAALGIGALVIAIGLIVANWEELVGWIEKTFPGLKKVTDFFKNFQQVSSGVIKGVVESFKGLGRVVANFFGGDWGAALNEAKNLGKNFATAYNQGYAEKDAELKRKQAMKDRKFQLDLLDAQGKDVKGARIKYAQEELKDLKKGSDDYNDKLIQIEELKTKAREDGIKAREENAKKAEDRQKKIDEKALENEKKNNDALLKENQRRLDGLSTEGIDKQKSNIAKEQITNQDTKLIEQEQQKLLSLEIKYNRDRQAIINDSIEKEKALKEKAIQNAKKGNVGEKAIQEIADFYDQSIKSLTDDSKQLNKTISEQIETFNNKSISIKIKSIVDSKVSNDYYDNIDKREKELKARKTNSKMDELLKERDLIRIQNERFELEKKALVDKKEKLDELLKSENIDPNIQVDSINLKKQINDLNKKISENTEVKVNVKIEDENKAKLKGQLDELFAFAQNGLLLQIGIDPQALSKIKSDVENAIKVFNDPKATDKDRILAGAQAAQSAVVAGIDMIRASERAAAEEKIAEINAQEEAELKAAEGNEQKQAIIRQKADQKRKEIKRKEFEADKRASIIKATIETALAVIKAAPNPILMALAGFVGAAQIALISSQPIPKFEKGGMVGRPILDGLLSGRPHSAGGVLLEAEGGEWITNKKSTKKYLPLLEAINDDSISGILDKHYIMPAIEAKEAEVMQVSQKRMDDVENKIINRTIAKTLDAMRKDNKINTSEIVTAIKKDKFTL